MSKPLCSEPNCGAQSWARGLCQYHYARQRRAQKPPKPRKKYNMHPASLDNIRQKGGTEKPRHPAENIPAFAEFIGSRATDQRNEVMRELQEQARADPVRFPGGIVPWSMIPPDPRPQMEIVRFTRIPGGRGIKRC